MKVYEITFGNSSHGGTTQLFIAEDFASAVAVGEESIADPSEYLQNVRDLGCVQNCYVGA